MHAKLTIISSLALFPSPHSRDEPITISHAKIKNRTSPVPSGSNVSCACLLCNQQPASLKWKCFIMVFVSTCRFVVAARGHTIAKWTSSMCACECREWQQTHCLASRRIAGGQLSTNFAHCRKRSLEPLQQNYFFFFAQSPAIGPS